MRGRRVQLGEQESSLTFTLITNNVSWYRESVYKEVLSIRDGDFKQLFKVFIAFFILISLVPPLGNKFSVEDEDVEEGIEKKDDIVFDGHTVEEYGHGRSIESVRHKSRLNHDKRIVNVFFVQGMAKSLSAQTFREKKIVLPIESSFIRTVIEYLQELTSTKMEHELRINAEVIRQSETRWIFFSIIGELLTKSDEHAI